MLIVNCRSFSNLRKTILNKNKDKKNSIATIILAVFETTGVLLYRYRYHLLYIWYRIKSKGEDERIKQISYKYDAFVAHSHKNYSWVRSELYRYLEEEKQQFHFCFHNKDFIVGAAIQENIVNALDDSRHVILVVSNDALKSEWWQFEVDMAHQVSLHRKWNMIICVFLEAVENDLMTSRIRRMLNLFTCLRWPKTEEGKKLFWIKLVSALNR